MQVQKIIRSLKGLLFLSTLLLLLIFNASNTFADFYVFPGSRGVGTKINSLPYTISSSGFYYIARNLSCSTATAITINADHVTLDLMGFSLDGSGGTTGYCGIYMNSRTKIEIRNGTIKNFYSYCIYEESDNGAGHRIINVRFRDNRFGIKLSGGGHLIERCNVSNTTNSAGIKANHGSTVIGNIVYNNAAHGIDVGTGNSSIVIGNTCFSNNYSGILASGGKGHIIKGNTCYDNGMYGIYSDKGASVIGNACYLNGKTGTYYGIYSLGGIIDQNACYDNGSTGSNNIDATIGCVLGTNHQAAP